MIFIQINNKEIFFPTFTEYYSQNITYFLSFVLNYVQFQNLMFLTISFPASLDEDRSSPCGNMTNDKGEPLSPKQRHQMKHRELFLSRQVETLPATHIRGKCSVTLLNETESLLSYLNKDVSCSKVEFQSFIFKTTTF